MRENLPGAQRKQVEPTVRRLVRMAFLNIGADNPITTRAAAPCQEMESNDLG
jgi:hypothetical protein